MLAVQTNSGPLEVHASATSGNLQNKLRKELALLDVSWPDTACRVELAFEHGPALARQCSGSYLRASRMNVDFDGTSFSASCDSGAWCCSGPEPHHWKLVVPLEMDEWVNTDIERMLSLVWTSEWRGLGWIPIHAGAVGDDSRWVLLCAESGGGKSSLTAAFLHRGWTTLGDDKLLLRIKDGLPGIRALARTFNLHPNSAKWFPEVGDIEHLPRYSSWTHKRKVQIEDYWPGQTRDAASPTHLVSVQRSDEPGIRVEPLSLDQVLATLLRQTVIPNDPVSGRKILKVIATTASTLKGFRLCVGPDAYAREGVLDELLDALKVEL